MATFTSTRAINIWWRGIWEFVGAAGTQFVIADDLYDEFNAEMASVIPGLSWVSTSDYASLPIAQANVTNLVSDLAAKAPTASPTFTGTANFASIIAAAVTATTARFKGGPWYDAKAYGATGDGVTDDTTAIRTALAAAGGATLYLPAGNYIISGAISATTARTNIVGSGATISQTTNSTSIFCVGVDNVALNGLTFVQTVTSGGSTDVNYGSAVVFKLCRNGSRCFCCLEVCHEGAIKIEPGWALKLVGRKQKAAK